jgi:hypothetical protein
MPDWVILGTIICFAAVQIVKILTGNSKHEVKETKIVETKGMPTEEIPQVLQETHDDRPEDDPRNSVKG